MCYVPKNGRFEYLSGEDPGHGQPVVKAIRSTSCCECENVNNNQETNRHFSENVDERTRFEMYYPPFVGAIESGVGSVMCSYNKSTRCGHRNNSTLMRDLKFA